MSSGEGDQPRLSRQCQACGRQFAECVAACPHDGTMLIPIAVDPFIGTVLADRYEILDLLGTGGMGTVYKGRHVLMKRLVAVKILHAHLVASARSLQRFQYEAQAASHLSHQNIVGMHDFGMTSLGQPYLVMDYLEGRLLAEEIGFHGFLSVERAVPIFLQICEALGHAHHKGVLHRDLKPGNIVLLDSDEQHDLVKIVDFGIAKLLPESGEDELHLTQTGEVFGSPLYMSPEQCVGHDLDTRADIYMLGCVMYETLTGKPPIVGATVFQTMNMHLYESPRPMSSTNPHILVPEQLESIVLKALAKDRNSRHASMLELRDELRHFSVQLSGQIKTDGPLQQPDSRPPGQVKASTSQDHSTSDRSGQVKAAAAGKQLEAIASDVSRVAGEVLRSDARPVGSASTPAAPSRWRAGTAAAKTRLLLVLFGVIILSVATTAAVLHFFPASHQDSLSQSDLILQWEKFNQDGEKRLEQGQLAEAESSFRAALAPASKLDTPQLRLAHSLKNMGVVYEKLHKYTEAELACEKSLSIRAAANSLESPDVLESMTHLANIYSLEGKYEYAEFQLRKLLPMEEMMFGADSVDTAKTRLNLAKVLGSQGKLKEADAQYKKALPIVERSSGPNQYTGVVTVALHKYSQAQLALEKALAVRSARQAAVDKDAVEKMRKLADIYLLEQNYPLAEFKFRALLPLEEKLFGADSLEVAAVRLNVAISCVGQRQFDEADEQYRLVVPVVKKNAAVAWHRLAPLLESYAEQLSRSGERALADQVLVLLTSLRIDSNG